MRWDKEPTLKEFAKVFHDYVEDIGCTDNEQGWIGSHKIVGRIRVYNIDPNDDTAYEIVGLDMRGLGGCGCPADIEIRIRKVEE